MHHQTLLSILGASSSFVVALAAADANPLVISNAEFRAGGNGEGFPALAIAITPNTKSPRNLFKRQSGEDVCGRNFVYCDDFLHCCPAGNTCSYSYTQGEYVCFKNGGTNGGTNGGSNGGDDGDKKGLSGGAIAGIVIGILLVAAIAGGVTWFVLKKKKKATANAATAPPAGTFQPVPPPMQQYNSPPPPQQAYEQGYAQAQTGYDQNQYGVAPIASPYTQPAPQYTPPVNDGKGYYAPQPPVSPAPEQQQYYQPYNPQQQVIPQATGGQGYYPPQEGVHEAGSSYQPQVAAGAPPAAPPAASPASPSVPNNAVEIGSGK